MKLIIACYFNLKGNWLLIVALLMSTALRPQTRFITSDDFRESKMRGFNLSIVHTLAQLNEKNIPAARSTGANVGRYWITVNHDADNVYAFTDTAMLTTLDSAVRIAQQVKMYLVITLQVLPDQGKCDLWGNTARKNGVIKLDHTNIHN